MRDNSVYAAKHMSRNQGYQLEKKDQAKRKRTKKI